MLGFLRGILAGALALALTAAQAQQAPTFNIGNIPSVKQSGVWTFGVNGPVAVTQSGLFTVAQGAPGTQPWPVSLPSGQSVSVANFPATQPVSGMVAVTQSGTWTVALPSGTTIASTQSGAYTVTQGPAGASAWKVDGSGVTQPVSLASVPSHAVTNAGAFPVQNTATVVGGNTVAVKTDGSATTQPVSGTVSVGNFPGTQPVSLATVPSHAVTNAGTFAVQNTATIVGGNTVAVKVDGSTTTQPVSGTIAVGNFPATQQISAASLPLPSGAATAANQTSEISAILSRARFSVAKSTSLAASAFLGDSSYVALGPTPADAAFVVATFYSAQAGSYFIQANDGSATFQLMQTGSLTAGTMVTVKLPIAIVDATATRYRGYIQNGATASNNAVASIALTAN
ncbi:hypothetical protein [Methylobacterium sp. WL8]|uniref:hypothetical protein n=1 Tax=Methylobacterium sp. WL8 TaxID=2603899 RepID=UPI0011C7120B|nr:hypothetical protein [Methylobacterium sp. WL8]TXN79297.1 hypothetical protein FV234_21055 [Methylobacterium sp. WL8]